MHISKFFEIFVNIFAKPSIKFEKFWKNGKISIEIMTKIAGFHCFLDSDF